MDVPPSRYRVVEKDRRLIVIDRRAGEAPAFERSTKPRPEMRRRPRDLGGIGGPPKAAPAPAAAPDRSPSRFVSATNTSFRTARWFDDEGPRTIVLSDSATGQLAIGIMVLLMALVVGWLMFGWLLVIPIGFLVARPRAWRWLRQGATLWLTAADAGDGQPR